MRKCRHSEHLEENPEINISPLIDMMFLLLIFFIVNAGFMEDTSLSIQKPKATAAKMIQNKSFIFSITRDGKIFYAGQKIELSKITDLLKHSMNHREEPVVLVADRSSQSGTLVQVLDACNLAGAKNINVATEKIKS